MASSSALLEVRKARSVLSLLAVWRLGTNMDTSNHRKQKYNRQIREPRMQNRTRILPSMASSRALLEVRKARSVLSLLAAGRS